MGFIIHFYIILKNCYFLAYSSVSKKRNIKRSPNGMKPSGALFLERKQSRRLGVEVKEASRWPRGWGARPLSRGPLEHLPTDFFRLYKPTYPKTMKYQDRSGVPPPQASVATKNLLGVCSGTLPEGEPITGGHLHHPGAIHDEEGVVHPRG